MIQLGLTLNEQNKFRLINRLKEFVTEFSKYTENWNGYDANPIDSDVIMRSYEFINMIAKENLIYSWDPQVFPTANGTLQFEYEPDSSIYLEIEIFPDTYVIFYKMDLKPPLTMVVKTLEEVRDIIKSKLNI